MHPGQHQTVKQQRKSVSQVSSFKASVAGRLEKRNLDCTDRPLRGPGDHATTASNDNTELALLARFLRFAFGRMRTTLFCFYCFLTFRFLSVHFSSFPLSNVFPLEFAHCFHFCTLRRVFRGRSEQTKTQHVSSLVHVREDLPSRAVRIMRTSCSFCTLLQDTGKAPHPKSHQPIFDLVMPLAVARGHNLPVFHLFGSHAKPGGSCIHSQCTPNVPGVRRSRLSLERTKSIAAQRHAPHPQKYAFGAVTCATNGDYVLSPCGHGSCGLGGTRRHQSR